MKESYVKIALSTKGKFIYGTLRGNIGKNKVIVLCHGYGGWMHEMLLYNAARFFETRGYSSLRLSMYGGGENSRDIAQSDVMTHAQDIDDVVEYLHKHNSEWVGVVGHSYSGLAIVYSTKQAFNAAVLWDPTHSDSYDEPSAIKNLQNDFTFEKEINVYVSGKGSGYIYARTVFDNTYPKSHQMAAQFNVPTCVINAGWSKKQQQYGNDYAKTINAKTKHVVIPNSSHPFTEDGAAEKLFKETADYFDSVD